MYGIPLDEIYPTPAPKTWGFFTATSGAYSVTSPVGARGAKIHLIAQPQYAGSLRCGGSCVKYYEIPFGETVTFSGNNGNGSNNTTCNAPGLAMIAGHAGASSGGDLNYNYNVGTAIVGFKLPQLPIGFYGAGVDFDGSSYAQYTGCVKIEWVY